MICYKNTSTTVLVLDAIIDNEQARTARARRRGCACHIPEASARASRLVMNSNSEICSWRRFTVIALRLVIKPIIGIDVAVKNRVTGSQLNQAYNHQLARFLGQPVQQLSNFLNPMVPTYKLRNVHPPPIT